MSSIVDVCNLALGNIRANSINDLNESSIEAQVCKLRYPLAVEFLLRDFPWRFAHKVAGLTLLIETPKEWLYAYQYPSDCLNVKHVVSQVSVGEDRTAAYHFNQTQEQYNRLQLTNKTRIPYSVGQISDGTKVVFSNEPNAYIAYTTNETHVNNYAPDFIESLAWYLASVLAVPIVGAEMGRALRGDAVTMYNQMINIAKANSANESYNTSLNPESPTITARR